MKILKGWKSFVLYIDLRKVWKKSKLIADVIWQRSSLRLCSGIVKGVHQEHRAAQRVSCSASVLIMFMAQWGQWELRESFNGSVRAVKTQSISTSALSKYVVSETHWECKQLSESKCAPRRAFIAYLEHHHIAQWQVFCSVRGACSIKAQWESCMSQWLS